MVKQMVQDGVHQELATISKKCKELFAADVKQEDLDAMDVESFNYDDLDYSPTQDDDSISLTLVQGNLV